MTNLDTHHETAKNFENQHLGWMLVRRESSDVSLVATIHAIEHVTEKDGAAVYITALVGGTTEESGATEVRFRYLADERVEVVKPTRQ